MTETAAPARAPGRSSPAMRPLLIVAATVAVWTLPALIPSLPRLLGFDYAEKWFLDSYAILAAGDAVRAGLNPEVPNPLDILHRPHSYSDWWFVVERLGLTRADNFVVGLAWIAAFLVAAMLVLRARTPRATVLSLLFLTSPVVVLAVFRANNDLVVFVVLAAAALCLRGESTARIVAAAALVALATGLKFYPAVAAAFVVLLRPRPRLWLGGAIAAGLVGLALADVWSSIGRGEFRIPIDMHKTGMGVLFSDLGWSGRAVQAGGALGLAAAGLACALRGGTGGLAGGGRGPGERYAFLIGAITLVACFVAGVSHAYRWILALLLVPWLDSLLDDPDRGRRRAAWATLILLAFVCWGDGLLCLGLNLFWAAPDMPAVERVEKLWRLATQPLHWALVALLAGWLWSALLAAVPVALGSDRREAT